MDPSSVEPDRDSFWMRIIAILSVVVSGAVAFLILGPRPEGMEGSIDVSALPEVNAALNGLTTLILLVGFWLIKKRNFEAHKKVMLAAFGTSSAFLVTYIIYHWFKAGPAKYEGSLGIIYYPMLISHIILAALIIPMALITLYRGWSGYQRETVGQDSGNLAKHRKLARVTLPLWLYVSVTGVGIYVMVHL
jgi:putative membrane protein